MVKRKNIIGILIILCIFSQIIFIGINFNIDSGQKQKNSHSLVKVKSIGNKVFYVTRGNLKIPGKTAQSRQINLNVSHRFYKDFQQGNYSNINELIDFRKYIRQAIPHYFNCSNYKNNYLHCS